MNAQPASANVYQLRVWLRAISPMIWRRVLLRGDHTLADLHYVLQIAFGWHGEHLHCFRLHGREYCIPGLGGADYTADARTISLDLLGLRPRENFFYEYGFTDNWLHEIRVEQIRPAARSDGCPVCVAGKRAGPPEDCGGPWAYLEQRQQFNLAYVARYIAVILDEQTDADTREEHREELVEATPWILVDHFDRRAVNQRLQQYATGDAGWRDYVEL
jgi:hypothetical protein